MLLTFLSKKDRDELEGSVHLDILQCGQPAVRTQLPTFQALGPGGASKALRAGAELKNLEFYFFFDFQKTKDTTSRSSLSTLQPSFKNAFIYKSLW